MKRQVNFTYSKAKVFKGQDPIEAAHDRIAAVGLESIPLEYTELDKPLHEFPPFVPKEKRRS